eukprot:TRINITY_DN2033_c0_g1_i1.p1 TRINITY_DN2033_c0_g1~~TRINITY_DN2033_c0_g1_i1.p1  ORF type:complete len:405 (+),score=75.98 TRINITY_DN2033_c0_g1_i1:207-1421(+)
MFGLSVEVFESQLALLEKSLPRKGSSRRHSSECVAPIIDWVIEQSTTPGHERVICQALNVIQHFTDRQDLVITVLDTFSQLLKRPTFSNSFLKPICRGLDNVRTLRFCDEKIEEVVSDSIEDIVAVIMCKTQNSSLPQSQRIPLLKLLLGMKDVCFDDDVIWFIRRNFSLREVISFLRSSFLFRKRTIDVLTSMASDDPAGYVEQVDIASLNKMRVVWRSDPEVNLKKLIDLTTKRKFGFLSTREEARKYYLNLLLELTSMSRETIATIVEFCINSFFSGDILDVDYFCGNWSAAEVIHVFGQDLFVHYSGFPEWYDEWIPMRSERIAPPFTYTSQGKRAVIGRTQLGGTHVRALMADPHLNLGTEELIHAAQDKYGNNVQVMINMSRYENRENLKHLLWKQNS